ncbi:uncharacterized protein ARMOST_18000 [Armillaria ostoyae]|uniref:F-box domain-containing protein n=1 Tax=Armillaria ostoyae TaxID=47428 RepID=A0A284S0M9_ARMOS|nr:uncharacterized protein ARMOST_18000 [Armillaria ostoyae]
MECPPCQELSDLVVDALVNQGESLRNAALLSRSTLIRTRHHRYKHVVLRSSSDCNKFYAICTASKGVGLFVDSLKICGLKEDQAAAHASVLERLLELVASVKLIHFEGIPWDHLSFIGNSKGKRYNIPMVDLRQTVVASYRALASFIQAFPKLHTLALLSVSLGNDSSVSNLEETGSSPPHNSPRSHTRTRQLQGYIHPEELIALSFPPSLNHLHLKLNDYEHKNEQDILRWWTKCFSCPDIELSKIHVSLYADPHYPRLYRAFLANVFRSTFFHHPFVLPPKLAPDEEMAFHLIEKELWSELDNALAEIQGLKEFMIELPSDGDVADFEPLKDAIKEGMPWARDRGFLVFRMKRGI